MRRKVCGFCKGLKTKCFVPSLLGERVRATGGLMSLFSPISCPRSCQDLLNSQAGSWIKSAPAIILTGPKGQTAASNAGMAIALPAKNRSLSQKPRKMSHLREIYRQKPPRSAFLLSTDCPRVVHRSEILDHCNNSFFLTDKNRSARLCPSAVRRLAFRRTVSTSRPLIGFETPLGFISGSTKTHHCKENSDT